MARNVVYIAHPLSGDWDANLAAAREFVRQAFRRGWYPVAPYLMTEGILYEPDDRDLGLAYDLVFVRRSDELWLCGPRVSEGMAAERRVADDIGMPIRRFFAVTEIPDLCGQEDTGVTT